MGAYKWRPWNENLHPRGKGGKFAPKMAKVSEARSVFGELSKIEDPWGAGFTKKADDLRAAGPTKGYALSMFRPRERRISAWDLTPEDLDLYIQDNADLLSKPNYYFGLWYNPEDQTFYLDVSKVVDDLDEAVKEAKENGQLAVWDLSWDPNNPDETRPDGTIITMTPEERRAWEEAVNEPLKAAEAPPDPGSSRNLGPADLRGGDGNGARSAPPGGQGGGQRDGGEGGAGLAPPEDPRTFMDAELFMTEQEIRDKGMALDIPYEAGSPDPKKIIYAETDDEEHKVPESILKGWSLNPDLPESGPMKDKINDPED